VVPVAIGTHFHVSIAIKQLLLAIRQKRTVSTLQTNYALQLALFFDQTLQ
jgi:hypothetical protein